MRFVIADLHFTTIGGTLSLSPLVARAVSLFKKRNLNYKLHAIGTNIEGDIDDILLVTKELISDIHSIGERRVMIELKITSRTDRDQNIQEKIDAVVAKI